MDGHEHTAPGAPTGRATHSGICYNGPQDNDVGMIPIRKRSKSHNSTTNHSDIKCFICEGFIRIFHFTPYFTMLALTGQAGRQVKLNCLTG